MSHLLSYALALLCCTTIISTHNDNFARLRATIPFGSYNSFIAGYYKNRIINANGESSNNIKYALYSDDLSNINIDESLLSWHKYNISLPAGMNMPVRFDGQSFALYDGSHIYGIWENQGLYSNLVIFDLYTYQYINLNTYESALLKPTAASCVAVSELSDKVFVISGLDSYNAIFQNILQIYDIHSDIWSYGSNINIAVSKAACSVYENKYNQSIYVFGGRCANCPIGSSTYIQKYDILLNKWHTLSTHLHVPRIEFKCMTFVEKIYCVGGTMYENSSYFYPLESIEVFNAEKEIMENSSLQLNVNRSSHVLVRYQNDYMLVYGGYTDPRNQENSIEISPKLTHTSLSRDPKDHVMIVMVSIAMVIALIVVAGAWYHCKRHNNAVPLLDGNHPRIM